MKHKINYGMMVLMLLFFSCKEEYPNHPLSKGEKPNEITIVSQKEIAGGAEITFQAPKNKDFTYVKAVYSIKPDKEKMILSSLYEDKIILTGFIKEGTYPVKFYSVSKGEVESEPLIVNVKVSKPSFLDVIEKLQVFDDFSGFTVVFDNASEQDIRITVLTYDPLVRRYVTEYTHFSNDVRGSFRRAGYTKPQEFKFVVTDRWENHSDTLVKMVSPLEEFEMDKTKFESYPLPPFNNRGYDSYTLFSHLWNGKIGNFYNGTTGWMSATNSTPIDFCIDIGVKAKLGRIKMYHPCSSNNVYTAFTRYTPRELELYGSNDPNPDGTWESWDKLGEFESIRPTGMSTEEVRNYGCAIGEDFFVPGEAQAYRYFRIKVVRQWGGTAFFTAIDELSFFGATVN